MVGADGTRKDPNISQEVVREARFPMPSMREQIAIAGRLNAASRSIGHLMAHVGEHVERLREYRSSLISAAVAGQLDLGAFGDKKAA